MVTAAIVAIAWALRDDAAPEAADADADRVTLQKSQADDAAGRAFFTTAEQARQFVGNDTCLECHAEYQDDYLASGHSRTIRPIQEFEHLDRLAELQFEDTVRDVTIQYHVEGSLVDTSLPAVFGSKRLPLNFAFGSGDHAITFVSLVEDQDGTPYGVEHRVSWYRHGDRFDYTPRHEELSIAAPVEHFGRVVPAGKIERCIACHTTTAAVTGLQVERLMPNVGCESCHGPGHDHVAAVNEGADDPAIRFAADTWSPQDEIATCGQCHRTVDELPSEVLQPEEQRIIRFQSVGLVLSKCYTGSEEQLSCSTCHNPHQKASATAITAYEQKCIQCHSGAKDSVSCPVSEQVNCIQCHMPPVEIHPGILFHDHWIRVRAAESDETAAGSGRLPDSPH